MKHYSPIKFNESLKEGSIFSQDDAWVWYQGESKYVSTQSTLLDMALIGDYLELIPDDPAYLPIRIGDKVVDQDDYCFIVASINTAKARVNDIDYVPASGIPNDLTSFEEVEWLTYCIVRTYSAWVWAWYVDLKKVNEIMVVKEARRLWRWNSQFTLSELAQEGFGKNPEYNKYAISVTEVHLTNVIELIPTSESAKNQIINAKNYGE